MASEESIIRDNVNDFSDDELQYDVHKHVEPRNHTFHTQSHTRNTMHNIRPIDLYACGTILKNTVNAARESM